MKILLLQLRELWKRNAVIDPQKNVLQTTLQFEMTYSTINLEHKMFIGSCKVIACLSVNISSMIAWPGCISKKGAEPNHSFPHYFSVILKSCFEESVWQYVFQYWGMLPHGLEQFPIGSDSTFLPWQKILLLKDISFFSSPFEMLTLSFCKYLFPGKIFFFDGGGRSVETTFCFFDSFDFFLVGALGLGLGLMRHPHLLRDQGDLPFDVLLQIWWKVSRHCPQSRFSSYKHVLLLNSKYQE